MSDVNEELRGRLQDLADAIDERLAPMSGEAFRLDRHTAAGSNVTGTAQPAPRRWFVAAAIVVTVTMAASVMWVANRRSSYVVDTQSPSSMSPGASSPAGWTLAPDLPIGDQRIAGTSHTTVWTGSEVVLVGGLPTGTPTFSSHSPSPPYSSPAYNPRTNTWRVLPALPANFEASSAVWTGSVIIAIGYTVPPPPDQPATRELVSIDPTSGEVKTLATPPDFAPSELVSAGSIVLDIGFGDQGTLVIAAIDPATGNRISGWSSQLDPAIATVGAGGLQVAWSDGHLIVVVTERSTAESRTYVIDTPPISEQNVRIRATITGPGFKPTDTAWSGNTITAYDQRSGRVATLNAADLQPVWSEGPLSGLSPRARATTAASNAAFYVWGGDADQRSVLSDGAQFNLETRTWTRLPALEEIANRHLVGQTVGRWISDRLFTWWEDAATTGAGRRLRAATLTTHAAGGAPIIASPKTDIAAGTPTSTDKSTASTLAPVTSPATSTTSRDVEITVQLSTSNAIAGSAIDATVVVNNRTGQPITRDGCISAFAVALTNVNYTPRISWPSCLQALTVPPGESTYPVKVATRYLACTNTPNTQSNEMPVCLVDGERPPLPPGRYQAALYQQPIFGSSPPPIDVDLREQ